MLAAQPVVGRQQPGPQLPPLLQFLISYSVLLMMMIMIVIMIMSLLTLYHL